MGKYRGVSQLDRRLQKQGYAGYDDYLRSAKWQALRREVFGAQEGRCSCGEPVTHLHHATYTRLGDERFNDVVGVCTDCHAEIHYRCRHEDARLGEATDMVIRRPKQRHRPEGWELGPAKKRKRKPPSKQGAGQPPRKRQKLPPVPESAVDRAARGIEGIGMLPRPPIDRRKRRKTQRTPK